ncbi:riboflavin kinase [Candidatus Micrarchaeota archaeon]|nr:MAG: riboflavin kinase [Candidatus Micrarchaeota archaeon]
MVESRYLPLLLLLLKRRVHAKPVKLSTNALSDELSISQQSASRWLSELEQTGYLVRSSAGISLTQKGLEELRGLHSSLSAAFQPTGSLRLRGRLFTGLKEGKYYMAQEGYRRQFKKKLGFAPYAGTLNLRLDEPASRAPLDLAAGERIEGFKAEDRFFGGLTAYSAIINDKIRGALVVPDRTHYRKDVIELVAKENIRKELDLKDGDLVEVRIDFQ